LHRDEDTSKTLILLDVGHRFTTVVFSRDGEIAFVKVVPFGMERFDREIAAKLGVKPEEAETLRKAWYAVEADGVVGQTLPIDGGPDGSGLSDSSSGHPKSLDPSVHRMLTDTLRGVAEALAREVSLCVRYYTVTFRGHQIERLLVSGGGAYEPFLLATIKAQVGVDVERARPLRGMDGHPDAGDDPSLDGGSEWAVALGLALKEWWATPCPEPAQTPGRSLVPVV
jgi:type IV pilus assembly protein PilM